jgi:hypothetical protein
MAVPNHSSLALQVKKENLAALSTLSEKCCLKNLALALDSEALLPHSALSTIERFMSCRDWSADILDETPIYWCKEKSKGLVQMYPSTAPVNLNDYDLKSRTTMMIRMLARQSFVLCHNTSRMSSPMLTACSVGAVEAAEIFGLAYPPCLTIENNVRESTIHVAAKHGQLEILRLLKRLIPPDDFLDAVTAKTNFGLSSFGSAVRAGHIEAAYLLLRWGGLSSGGSRNKAVVTRASVRENLKPIRRANVTAKTQYALKNARRALRYRMREDLRTFSAFRMTLWGMNRKSGAPFLAALAGHAGLLVRAVADYCGVLAADEHERVRQAAEHLNFLRLKPRETAGQALLLSCAAAEEGEGEGERGGGGGGGGGGRGAEKREEQQEQKEEEEEEEEEEEGEEAGDTEQALPVEPPVPEVEVCAKEKPASGNPQDGLAPESPQSVIDGVVHHNAEAQSDAADRWAAHRQQESIVHAGDALLC